MGGREYPRIGSAGHKPKWQKDPRLAPHCIVEGCAARATHQPEIEVNWFRGDDERSGPACKAHSTDARVLLAATEKWKAAMAARQQAAEARKAAARSAPEGGA